MFQKCFKISSQIIVELLEYTNVIVAVVLLSLSLYLAYQTYKRRSLSLTRRGWFASLSFLSFSVMVLSQSLMLLSSDYVEAELVTKFAITSAIIGSFFTVKSFENKETRPVSGNGAVFYRLSYGVYSAAVISLTWLTTPFKIESTNTILTGQSFFPVPSLWYILILYSVVVLFAVHVLRANSGLLFPTVKMPKLNEMLPGLLCTSLAFSVFFFNAALPVVSVDLMSFGQIMQVGILGVMVYLWRRPTLLETFFKNPNERKMKNVKVAEKANITMLKVEQGNDYTQWINDFLANSEPSMNLLLTYEGSKIMRSRAFNERCKMICISLSEELQVRKADEVLVVRLSENIISEMLAWALQNMRNGKLVFDNVSHLTLLVGLESTYSLLTMISELSSRYGVDVLFIAVNNMVDDNTLSTLEELVDNVMYVKEGGLTHSTRH